MKRSGAIRVAVAVSCLLGISQTARAQLAQSTFDTDTDGWLVANRGEVNIEFIDTRPATWRSTGGNPGGFVQASDTNPGWWHWHAPAKFLGSKSPAYGGSLSFDLISDLQTAGDGYFVHVILEGGGVSLIAHREFFRETNTWHRFTVPIAEAIWENLVTHLPATAMEMKSVLSNLTIMDINGEYGSGFDTGGLDNVVLAAGCPSVSIRLSEVEICWPSQSNAPYRIEYSSALETTNAWVALFTNLTGNGAVMCVYDKIPAGRPQRFYRVVCP
jgi:hypothetical protein